MTIENEDLPAAAGSEDASAIWDEIDNEESGAASSPEPSAAEAAERKDDAEFVAGADEDKGEEPPKADEPPAADPPADKEPKEPAPEPKPDPWAAAPPELREELTRLQRERESLELKLNRETGRTSALTKKLNEIAPATSAPKREPTERKAQIDKLREEYPEVASPLIAEIDDLRSTVSQLAQGEQERQQSRVAVEAVEVKKVHPDYQDVIRSNFDEFDAWVRSPQHPRWVLDAYEQNAQQVVNSKDVIAIVTEFKRFKGLPVGGAKTEPPKPGTSQPDPIAERRRRQLEGSITPTGTKGAGPGGGDTVPEEGDPALIWAAIESKEQRERARRR